MSKLSLGGWLMWCLAFFYITATSNAQENVGCEWVHVAGARSVAVANGVYRRVMTSGPMGSVAPSWDNYGQDVQLKYNNASAAWLIRSRSGDGVYYRAKSNASNPLLVPPRVWERVKYAETMGQNVTAAAAEFMQKDVNADGCVSHSEANLPLTVVQTIAAMKRDVQLADGTTTQSMLAALFSASCVALATDPTWQCGGAVQGQYCPPPFPKNCADGGCGGNAISQADILAYYTEDFSASKAEYVAEKTLRVHCVATRAEFQMRTGLRELVSYGFNFYGELGRSEKTLTLDPVWSPGAVKELGGSGNADFVEQVSLGCNHGLARTRSGKLWSWGSNSKGQLGRSESAGLSKAVPLPKLIPISELGGQGSVDLIAAGPAGSFSIVRVRLTDVSSKEILYSAGSNRYGQLGRSDANMGVDTFNPAFGRIVSALFEKEKGFAGFAEIAVGRHHAIVRTLDNKLISWGYNRYGQLGQNRGKGTDNPNPEPQAISERFVLANGASQTPAKLALGRFHSVVVTSDGSLFCFGMNLRGQCGPQQESDKSFVVGSADANPVPRLLPRALLGNDAVIAVAAGEYSTIVHTLTNADVC